MSERATPYGNYKGGQFFNLDHLLSPRHRCHKIVGARSVRFRLRSGDPVYDLSIHKLLHAPEKIVIAEINLSFQFLANRCFADALGNKLV